jgi:ABC-type glycerol-3-phosphate transport system substrate-binding protein
MVQRLLTAVAVFTAVLVLAACGGGSSVTQSEKTQSSTERTTTQPTARPDKVTSADRPGLGPLRHHRPRLVATRSAR